MIEQHIISFPSFVYFSVAERTYLLRIQYCLLLSAYFTSNREILVQIAFKMFLLVNHRIILRRRLLTQATLHRGFNLSEGKQVLLMCIEIISRDEN